MVNRRASIIALFLLASAMACQKSPSQETSLIIPSSPEPSSVFLITVDTLRSDRLGVYGNEVIKTPHLDRLATRGTVFLEAFAQSSTTTPSHASLFSGLYPRDHHAYSNFESIDGSLPSIAADFSQAGYDTFALVNMRHLNPEISGIASHLKPSYTVRATGMFPTPSIQSLIG